MNRNFLFVSIFSLSSVVSFHSDASTLMLDSIRGKGIDIVVIDDERLGAIRGARLVVGMPLPSVTWGINRHYVAYRRFGNKKDFRSYSYLGSRHEHSNDNKRAEGGVTIAQRIAGDEWWVDHSGLNLVGSSRSNKIEHHYQLLNKETGAPRETAFHESHWNRPITTFRW